jgi:hypothetical protein
MRSDLGESGMVYRPWLGESPAVIHIFFNVPLIYFFICKFFAM